MSAKTTPRNRVSEAQRPPTPVPTDGELLMRFAKLGDSAALAVVIDRHQQMVWGVCQRILVHRQDAEDAYQATFLILANKASTIGANDSVAGWLFRVAHNTALAARRKRKRRREETLVEEPLNPEPIWPDLHQREIVAALADELHALPARYRTPLVMRYLEGQSRRQIAEATEATLATVAGRLVRGKRLLRQRLARRGVSLAVALAGLTGATANTASAASTTVLSGPPMFDPTLTFSSAAPAVAQLAQEGVRSMLFASLTKPVAAIGALAAAVALAVLAPEAPAEPQAALALDATAPAAVATGSPAVTIAAAPQPDQKENPVASQPWPPLPEKAGTTLTIAGPATMKSDGSTLSIRGGSLTVQKTDPKSDKASTNQQQPDASREIEINADGEDTLNFYGARAAWGSTKDMIERKKQEYAKLAAEDGVNNYSQPGFEEAYWMHFHWKQQLNVADRAMRLLEEQKNAGVGPAGQIKLRYAQAIADRNLAEAKIRETDRLMKQAAIADQAAKARPTPIPPTPAAISPTEFRPVTNQYRVRVPTANSPPSPSFFPEPSGPQVVSSPMASPIFAPQPTVVPAPLTKRLAIGETLAVSIGDGSDPLQRTQELAVILRGKGQISLPGLKPIKLAGLTMAEASDAIRKELLDLMPTPKVTIRRLGMPPQAPLPSAYGAWIKTDNAPREQENAQLKVQLVTLETQLAQVRKDLAAAQLEAAAQQKNLVEKMPSMLMELLKGRQEMAAELPSSPMGLAGGQQQQPASNRRSTKLAPGEPINVEVYDRLNQNTVLHDQLTIAADGSLALGAAWGRVHIAGLELSDAEATVKERIASTMRKSQDLRKAAGLQKSSGVRFDVSVQIVRLTPTLPPALAPSYPNR